MSNTFGGGWKNPDYGFDTPGALGHAAGLFQGIFGNTNKPYDRYNEYQDKAAQGYQPYADAGTGALGNYQDWLNGQKDPSGFINGLQDQYQESPYAQYLQKQSLRAGQNAASASGLSGSTPLFQQLQQNAGNIASKDQNDWMQKVLGINSQYGEGQNNLINGGRDAQNHLSDIWNRKGEAAYSQENSKQNNFWNTVGNGIGLAGDLLPFFL